ncbi:MAG: hypothetical protein JWM46_267 [Candidatus Kaiserbacteria bacterium]|nr:hypothetical protein [Candidatus Kaiserbacteria bacterium]
MDIAIDKKLEAARLAIARDIISAWCRLRQKTVEDIAAMADDTATEVDVALLAHVVRTYAEVDVVVTGREMGISGRLVLSLRKHTHNKVTGQTALGKKLHNILVEAGLRTAPPKPVPDSDLTPKSPKLPRKKREDHAKRRAEHDALLKTEGEELIKKILAQFQNAERDRVFSTMQLPHLRDIRYISYAVLYHRVLGKSDYVAIARYFDKQNTSVSHGIELVSDAIADGRPSPLMDKIVRVCNALQITPEQLKY